MYNVQPLNYHVHQLNGAAPCGSLPVIKVPVKSNNDTHPQDELKLRVMRVLEENPQATQREIASELGVSLGGVNYCIKALVDTGFVKLSNFAKSNNKVGYAYILTPDGLAEKTQITARFLKRKMNEYEMLKKEIEQLKAEVGES